MGNNRAGITAAIYCSRAGIKTVVIDNSAQSCEELNEKTKSPSFISVTASGDLSSIVSKAIEYGTKLVSFDSIDKMLLTNDTKYVETESSIYFAKSVIITAGSEVERFSIESEQQFRGKGIYYNVLSNIDNLRDKSVAIIGDGHSSVDEALFLSKIAKKVIIIRHDELKIKKGIMKELEMAPNIKLLYGYELVDAYGYEKLEGIYLMEIDSDKQKKLKIDAIIGALGKKPNIYDRHAYLEHRCDGYINVDSDMMTNIKGVFAAGAAVEKVIDEIPTDINNSTIAALSALKYIK